MKYTPHALALLIEENKIDVHGLLDFFQEAIHTEELFLELTGDIITLQETEHTHDTITLLTKFKTKMEAFCAQNQVTRNVHALVAVPGPEYDKLMNALKFLLLLKDFPMALDELSDDGITNP